MKMLPGRHTQHRHNKGTTALIRSEQPLASSEPIEWLPLAAAQGDPGVAEDKALDPAHVPRSAHLGLVQWRRRQMGSDGEQAWTEIC